MPDRTLNLDEWQTTERGLYDDLRIVWVPPPVPPITPTPGQVNQALPGLPRTTAPIATQSGLPDFLQGNITLPLVGSVPKVLALVGAVAAIWLLSSSGGRR